MGVRRKTEATDSDGKKLQFPFQGRSPDVTVESGEATRTPAQGPVEIIDSVNPVPISIDETDAPAPPEPPPDLATTYDAPPGPFVSLDQEATEEQVEESGGWGFLKPDEEEDTPPAEPTSRWGFLTGGKNKQNEVEIEAEPEPEKEPQPEPEHPPSRPRPAQTQLPPPKPVKPQNSPTPLPRAPSKPTPPQPAPQSLPREPQQQRVEPKPSSEAPRSPYARTPAPVEKHQQKLQVPSPGPNAPARDYQPAKPTQKPQAPGKAEAPAKKQAPKARKEPKPKKQRQAKAQPAPTQDDSQSFPVPVKSRPEPSISSPQEAKKPKRKVGPLMAMTLAIRDFTLFCAALVPAVFMGWLVYEHSVALPYGEDWQQVETLRQVHDGNLELIDLHAAQPDGQRIIVPPAAHLFLSRLTDGNAMIAIWLNFGVMAFTSLGVFWLLARSLGGGAKLGITYMLANLVIFSPVHWPHLLSTSHLGNLLALCGIVWACFFAVRSVPWWLRLPFCLLFALIASYSSVYGLIIWPVVFILTLLIRHIVTPVGRFFFLTLWTLAAVAVIGDYFIDFTSYANFDASRFALLVPDNLEQAVGDWFAMLSVALYSAGGYAADRQELMIAGVVVICAFLMLAIRWMLSPSQPKGRWNDWNRSLPWIGLGIAGFGGTALTYLMTSQHQAWSPGPEDFLLVVPILLGILVCYVIISHSKAERRPNNFFSKQAPLFWSVAFFAALIHQGLGWSYGIPNMARDQSNRLQAQSQLLFANVLPPYDTTPLGGGDAADVRQRIQFLEANDYLQQRPFQDNLLSNLEIAPEKLPVEGNLIKRLENRTDGYRLEGTSRLAGHLIPRPADAVLVVAQDSGSREVIALAEPGGSDSAFGWSVMLPKPLADSHGSAPLELWAMDAREMQAYQLPVQLVVEEQGLRLAESY